jgi:carbamoyltransferase
VIILGISAFHANASAAIVVDGRLVAAVEEERFNRVKYAAGFPAQAVRYCLEAEGVTLTEVDHVAIPRNPWVRLGTKLRYALRMPAFAWDRACAATRFAVIRDSLAAACDVHPGHIHAQFHRVEHHRAHLASAFFVSPFDRAAVLSADGLGDFASTMWAAGEGSHLRVHGAVAFPHSMGMYYTALTQYLGFLQYGEEYKVMGLAASGEPAYRDEFGRIIAPEAGVAFRLGLEFFTHHRHGAEMTWSSSTETPTVAPIFSAQMENLLGPARPPGAPLEKRHRDMAATLQARLEDIFLHSITELQRITGLRDLCLAGGVAFNCVANGKILSQTGFERVYVQPAAGDAGLSVGAAFHVAHEVLGLPRQFIMEDAHWGPEFSATQIRQAVNSPAIGAGSQVRELAECELLRHTAELLAAGKIVGWFQGRAEWGPRALGNRSILADPRRPNMKEILNRRIKHREEFRPFAPSIPEEAVSDYFECSHPSPFMTFAFPVRPEKRSEIPAPTHLDGTARLQTVSRSANPLFWKLIDAFGQRTGVPVLVNTSFNDNEPIVCRPQEALDCFLRTHMDVLAIGNFLLEKLPASAAHRDDPASGSKASS